MKLIIRKQDKKVMNARQSNDWHKWPQLKRLRMNLEHEKDKTIKSQLKAQIKDIENEYHNDYVKRRLNSIIRQYGGILDDYELLEVSDDEKEKALTAKYITYDGKTLKYDTNPRWEIDKNNPGQINVLAPQWVRGNHTLLENDYTNFREEEFKEDIYFSLEFWQNEGTQDIVVEIFTWYPFEDRVENPKGKRFCAVICQGVYHHKTKIIEVR